MVDAIDLRLFENVVDDFVEFPGGCQITAERFLNDDAHPRFGICGARQSGAAELFDNVRINFGRSGEIEQTIAAEIFLGVEFGETAGELRVGLLIGVIAGTVEKIRGKFIPLGGIDGADVRHGFGSFAGGGAEAVVIHRSTGKADDGVT